MINDIVYSKSKIIFCETNKNYFVAWQEDKDKNIFKPLFKSNIKFAKIFDYDLSIQKELRDLNFYFKKQKNNKRNLKIRIVQP